MKRVPSITVWMRGDDFMKYIVIEPLAPNTDMHRFERAVAWLKEDGYHVVNDFEVVNKHDVAFTVSNGNVYTQDAEISYPLRYSIAYDLERLALIMKPGI